MVRLNTTVNPRVRYTGGARPRVRHCAPRFSCRHLLFFYALIFFFGLGQILEWSPILGWSRKSLR